MIVRPALDALCHEPGPIVWPAVRVLDDEVRDEAEARSRSSALAFTLSRQSGTGFEGLVRESG